MVELNTLGSLGLTLPTPAYLIGAILFGLVGFAAYRYGKRTSLNKVKWTGVALMRYPYAISGTAMLYLVGAALSLASYVWWGLGTRYSDEAGWQCCGQPEKQSKFRVDRGCSRCVRVANRLSFSLAASWDQPVGISQLGSASFPTTILELVSIAIETAWAARFA